MLKKIFASLAIPIGFAVAALPEGFVYLQEVAPEIRESVRYYSTENFVGERIDGYKAPRIILTKEAAAALKNVARDAEKEGYILVVYDGFRPQRAVNHFMRAKMGEGRAKRLYFPDLTKKEVFERGFVAEKSGHSRGSTVDLTIMKEGGAVREIPLEVKRGKYVFLDDGTEDMGMHWDFFGRESWHESPLMAPQYNKKRAYLKAIMNKNGFKEMRGEWWHYTLANEPYPDTYFDFEIK